VRSIVPLETAVAGMTWHPCNPDDKIRCFVAFELNESIRESLEDVQRELRRLDGLRVKWTDPANFHLTLQFLGSISREQLSSVVQVVDRSGKQAAGMELDIQGLGLFGPQHRPRVVWAGVRETRGLLQSLASHLRGEFAKLGWAREERPFHPHITLGRIQMNSRVDSLTSQVASATTRAFGSCRAERVTVFQSVLRTQGASYQVLHVTRLKGV